MTKHIDNIKLLMYAWGTFQIVIAGLVALLMMGLGGLFGVIGGSEGEAELMIMGGVYAAMGVGIGIFAACIGGVSIAAGYGIGQRKNWGRIIAMIIAALSVFSVPIGTIFGGFVLYVMFDAEVGAEFS